MLPWVVKGEFWMAWELFVGQSCSIDRRLEGLSGHRSPIGRGWSPTDRRLVCAHQLLPRGLNGQVRPDHRCRKGPRSGGRIYTQVGKFSRLLPSSWSVIDLRWSGLRYGQGVTGDHGPSDAHTKNASVP